MKIAMSPPDGEWGWMVVFGSWIIDFLIFGFFRGSGLVYLECMRFFGSTRSQAAWIPVLMIALSFLMAPVAGVLVYHYPYRQIVFLGGMIATSGLVICHYAPTIAFVYVGFGIILGTGFGLALSPHLSIVGLYFKQHRALATGITISGGAIGTFVIGPLVQFLIDEYGLRGAFLVMSAIMLHICFAATLYRPIDYIITPNSSIHISDDDDFLANGGLRLQVHQPHVEKTHHETTTKLDELPEIAESDPSSLMLIDESLSSEKIERREEINQNEYDFNMKSMTESYDEKGLAPLADIDETKISESDATSEEILDRALHFASQRTSRGLSTVSVMTVPKIMVTSSDGMAWTPSSYSAGTANHTISPGLSLQIRPQTLPEGFIPPLKHLLLDELLILVSLAYGFTVAAYVAVLVVLPDYIKEEIKGLSVTDGIACVSAAAAGDLLARVAIGWFVDRLGDRKRFLYQWALFAFGVIFLVFPFGSSLPVLLILCILLGLLYGVCLIHSPCFLADYFGPNNLPFTMGFMLAVAGMPTVFLGLIIGAIRDSTGTYCASFWILGSILILASLSWFLQPWLLRRHEEREADYEIESIPPVFL